MCDIILLQETHLTQELEYITNSQFKLFDISYSHGQSNSRGVLIGLSKKLDIADVTAKKDEEGRLVIISCTLQGTGLKHCLMFTPRTTLCHKNYSLKKFFNFWKKTTQDNIICMGGDYNVTLSLGDRKQKIKGRAAVAESIFEIVNKYNMVDIWRQLHPKRRQYTWSRNKGRVASRLDYWWVPNRLIQKAKSCKIMEAIGTDHKAVIWQVEAPLKIVKGPGIWKLNDKFLNEDLLCKQVNEKIKQCEESMEKDPITKWQNFKMEIAVMARNYGKNRANKNRQELKKLENELNMLSQTEEQSVAQENRIIKLKQDLENWYDQAAKEALFRSKINWIRLGEKTQSISWAWKNKEDITKAFILYMGTKIK